MEQVCGGSQAFASGYLACQTSLGSAAGSRVCWVERGGSGCHEHIDGTENHEGPRMEAEDTPNSGRRGKLSEIEKQSPKLQEEETRRTWCPGVQAKKVLVKLGTPTASNIADKSREMRTELAIGLDVAKSQP